MGKLRVAVVGAGPTGLMAATLLHMKGVDVTIYDQTELRQKLPKAHQVNARAGELFREIGVLEAVERLSPPSEKLRYVSWAQSLAGVHYADGLFAVGPHDLSPSRTMNMGQNQLEQVLLDRIRALGLEPQLNHQVTSAAELGGKAALTVGDQSGRSVTEIFDYALACDGASSAIRRQLGIEMVGPPSLARFVSCYFTADLSRFYQEKPGPVRFLASPDLSATLIGFDIKNSWVLMVAYPEGYSPADYTTEIMTEFVRRAIGDRSVAFEITGIGNWNMSAQVATRFRDGPFFLLGDAAHRMPPSGGLGLNTGIQDAHNLAWKLSWVDRGFAGQQLLDSYEAERKPVGERNNAFSLRNAVGMFGIDKAVGVSCLATVEPSRAEAPLRGVEGLALGADSPDRHARLAAAQVAATEFSNGFDILNIELGYDYCEYAGETTPEARAAGPYEPSVQPGRLLPHVWIDVAQNISNQDVLDREALTLFVAEGANSAAQEVEKACAETRTPLAIVATSGWSPKVLSLWGERTQVNSDGAVLVRPDGHVAWSSLSQPDQANLGVLRQLLRIWSAS
jgi:2,4-dichlorophenol 6-monooxygenase